MTLLLTLLAIIALYFVCEDIAQDKITVIHCDMGEPGA